MTPDRHRLSAWKLLMYGNQLAELGAVQDAVDHYRRAAQLTLDDALLQSAVGVAFEGLTHFDEAIDLQRRAITLSATFDEARYHLGNALYSAGRTDEAIGAYQSAIKLAPTKGSYYWRLVQAKRPKADDALLPVMEQLLRDDTGTRREDRIHLHFALGLALTESGQVERGFPHLLEGNALYRASIDYDEAAALDRLARIPQVFTRDLLRSKAGSGDPSATPIFIVGMPRSGSTLIEQILASHPQVVGGGERPDFARVLTELDAKLATPKTDGAMSPETLHAAARKKAEALTPELLRQIASAYLARLGHAAAGVPSYRRITDKMLFNFEWIGLIHLALPNARFVHTRRSPVETCLSCYARLFKDVPFSYDLAELGRFYRAYDKLMAHWHDVLPPGVMLDVQYEDVVADVEGEARRLMAHCGLEWDDACLAFHETRRPVVTASATQVRQPIYRSSLVYSRPDAALIEPLVAALGARD